MIMNNLILLYCFNQPLYVLFIFNVILVGSWLTITALARIQNDGIFICFLIQIAVFSFADVKLLDLLYLIYIIYLIYLYLQLSHLALFFISNLLNSLFYLQYCTNFLNLVLLIEFILFSILGLVFIEKQITVGRLKAAIYFFLFNVIIALIFLYSCIIFLNIIILLQIPINLDVLFFIDMLGYYYLIQFNIYMIIPIIGLCSVVISFVILFKLTIIPFASYIIIVYSELSLILLLILITFYKFIFLIVTIKIFILNIPILSLYFVGIAIYTSLFGLLGYQQLNLKIVLTYLTLLQMSFILLGLTSTNLEASNYSLIYIIIYILQLVSVICILILIKCHNLDYFSRNLAYLKFYHSQQFSYLFILLLSMLGLPPFLGFFTKFFLILIIIISNLWLNVLAIVVLIFGTSIIYFQMLSNLFLVVKASSVIKQYKVGFLNHYFINLNLFNSMNAILNLLGIFVFPLSVTYYIIHFQ